MKTAAKQLAVAENQAVHPLPAGNNRRLKVVKVLDEVYQSNHNNAVSTVQFGNHMLKEETSENRRSIKSKTLAGRKQQDEVRAVLASVNNYQERSAASTIGIDDKGITQQESSSQAYQH